MAEAKINVGVTGVNEFKQDINKVKQSVQTLNTALALNEKQFKASGDAEEYMKNKADLLKTKIDQQNSIIATAEKALDAMKTKGVDKASAAFQSMQRTLLSAKSELVDAQTQLKNLGTDATGAKTAAEGMNDELKKIGKGVGWEEVSGGLSKLTDNLEKAGKAAIRMGKAVINSAKGSTGWADELLTLSQQTGVDVETLQKMQRAAEFVDTEVDTIVTAKDRLAKNRGKISDLLGISTDGKSDEDIFWEVGEALAGMGEGFDKAETAQDLFGKSWRELAPLFATGRKEYESMLEGQTVLTEDQVRKLGEADDAIKRAEQEIQQMKNQFWADNADKITGLLQWLVDNQETVKGALVTIGAGFAALKLAETGAELMKIINGMQTLGWLKGGSGATGAAGAAAAGNGAAGATGTGGIGLAGAGGLMGLAAIGAGFEWAKNRRNNAPELVRGTNANLMAQSSGVEGLMVDYLKAQQAVSALTWTESESEIARVTEQAAALRQQLTATTGGQAALDAYSDWRQENSYGSDYWQVPEYLQAAADAMDRMAQLTEELNGGEQNKQNSELAAAVTGMGEGLPGAIASAVSKAPINVYLDGTMMTNYFNSQLGPALATASQ